MKYERVFTPEEIELLGCDPCVWMDGAIEGKLNKCRKRLIKTTLEMEPEELLQLCQKIKKRLEKKEAKNEENISGGTEATI